MRAPTVNVAEAFALMKEGAVLVDVRERDEWDAAHVPGSVHVPMREVPARAAEFQGRRVLFFCRSGNRSGQVTAYLLSRGLQDVANVEGGILAWAAAGLPLER